MASIDIISCSFGGFPIQSGNGVPDHSAPIGSMYLDSISGGLYKLIPIYSGTTVLGTSSFWDEMPKKINALIISTASTASIVTSSVSTWYSLSSSTYGWSTIYNNGFIINNGKITLTAATGVYFINSSLTIKYNANLANYRVGISKNNSVPVLGFYTSGTLYDATAVFQSLNNFGILSMVSGDTIEFAFNSPDVASTTSNLSGASISIELIK